MLAVIPGQDLKAFAPQDKLNHVLAFIVLAYLLAKSFDEWDFWRVQVPVLMVYGIAIEVIQAFLPWRTGSIADVLANITGVVIYLVFVVLSKRRQAESAS